MRSNWIRSTFLGALVFAGIAAAAEPKTLPGFALSDISGKTVQSAEWKGKIVIVDFWATWCVACREAFPALTDVQSKYGDKLVVVGISTDKGAASKLSKFVQKNKLNYLVLHDPDEKVAGMFGFSAIPSLYVFSTEGNLLAYYQGLEKDNKAKLEKLLAENVK